MATAPNAFAKVYPFSKSNRLTLLEDPEKGMEYKLNLVKQAKHHINIVTYLWDASSFPKKLAHELKEANARGVEIRIVTNFVMTFGVDMLGKGRKEMKSMSDKTLFSYLALTPGNNIVATNNFHEKILLVDGKTLVMGGRNITDNSLSGKDMEVVVEGAAVNQVQDHFKTIYDFSSDLKAESKCKRIQNESSKAKCFESFNKNKFGARDPKFFPKPERFEDGEEARIITHSAILKQHELDLKHEERLVMKDDILDTVTKMNFKKLRFYNYFVMPTARFQNFLNKKLSEGSDIDMITNSYKTASFSIDQGYLYGLPESLELVKNGMKMYQWQGSGQFTYLHEKVLIFNDNRVMIGSHNFGTGSTSVSNEIMIDIKSERLASHLIDVYEGEKHDSSITNQVDEDFLQNESDVHAKKIKSLRKDGLVGKIIREIY